MKAILTITGNQRDGYTLTAALPTAWVQLFSTRMEVKFWGEQLCEWWHAGREENDYRSDEYTFDTLREALERREWCIREIESAKAALTAVNDVELVHEVEL